MAAWLYHICVGAHIPDPMELEGAEEEDGEHDEGGAPKHVEKDLAEDNKDNDIKPSFRLAPVVIRIHYHCEMLSLIAALLCETR